MFNYAYASPCSHPDMIKFPQDQICCIVLPVEVAVAAAEPQGGGLVCKPKEGHLERSLDVVLYVLQGEMGRLVEFVSPNCSQKGVTPWPINNSAFLVTNQ